MPMSTSAKSVKPKALPLYKSKVSRHETLSAFLFMAPALLFFAVFVIVPIMIGVVTSFFDYTDRNFAFNGLDNYIELFQNEPFLKSLRNTVVLVIGVVPVIVLFSILVSVIIYQRSAFVRSLFRSIFYLPVVTGTVSVVVVWKWIYDYMNGILNYIMKSGGLIDQDLMWLGDKRYALLAVLIVLFTTSVGQPIILYIAALGNVDTSHIEASQVDGANAWQVFRHIKWPAIMPTTLYVVVITTINSFQCFSLIQLLTAGGPNYNSSTVMYLLYETAFKQSRFGYANAMGVILAIIIGLFSLVQFKAFSSDVEY